MQMQMQTLEMQMLEMQMLERDKQKRELGASFCLFKKLGSSNKL